MFGGRIQAERIDGEVAVREPDAPRAAAEQRRELLIAPAQIEDGRHRVVLLCMGDEEVHEEGLPRPSRRSPACADIVDVQVPEIGVWCCVSKTARYSRPPRCALVRWPVSSVNRKLRSATFVLRRASRRRLWRRCRG